MPRPSRQPPATYAATILRAEPGKRLAKRYRDPRKKPDDYDAGMLFTAEQISCRTFKQFVGKLAELGPDQCLIRGAVRAEAKADVEAGLAVRRLAYDRGPDDPDGECPAAFEPAERNWIVLDVDESNTPFDPADVSGSVAAWRATLPAELQQAKSAFFLSASSHLSPTVRGKLVVALDESCDNATAAAYAEANGFDGSVCHTVQPNYFAAPIFEGCADPLARHRKPIQFVGTPAHLPTIANADATSREALLGARDAAPTDLPELSLRGFALAESIRDRWLDGDRIAGNAALHLFGWCLGNGWSKGEIGAMLVELDRDEPDARKRAEHWHILGNARAIEGPGGSREWLGDAFDSAEAAVNHDPVVAAVAERRAERAFQSASELAAESAAACADEWSTFESFLAPERHVEYLCAGLRLAPSRGKISVIAGNAGGGKGPIADHLAVCFALGLPAFERFECRQANVLLIDIEGALLTQRRLRRMARAMGCEPAELEGRLYHKDASSVGNLTAPENQQAIADVVARLNIGVVIVDSYTTAMLASGIDANTPQYALLAQMLGSLGVLVIAVGHANKASAKSGEPSLADLAYSQAFGAMAQTAIVGHYPDTSNTHVIAVGCARAPETGFSPFVIRFIDVEGDGLRVTVADSAPTPSAGMTRLRQQVARAGTDADRIEALLAQADTLLGGLTPRKIRDALGMNLAAYAAARDECAKRGTITEGGTPGDRHVVVRLTKGTP